MQLFRHKNRDRNDDTRKVYALYEIAHTAVDFVAAFSFLIGSVLFFWKETQFTGTWLFVIGSVCFALKPTIRLVREVHIYRMGKVDHLAKQAPEPTIHPGSSS